MNIKIKLFNYSKLELLFCVALFFEIFAMQLSLSVLPYMIQNFDLILKLFRYIGYVIVMLKIILDHYKLKSFLAIACLMITLGIGSLFSERTLFLTFLFIYGMKGVSFDKISKNILICMSLCIFFIIFGSQIGLIENWHYVQGSRYRYSLGYFYPSHVTSVWFYLVLLFCYIKKDSLKIYHVIAIEIINYWQYINTDSRTGSFLIALLVIVFYLQRFHYKKSILKVIYEFFLKSSFVICSLISVLACYMYRESEIFNKINSLTTNRLSLGHKAIVDYGISLFGKKIQWIGNGGVGHVFSISKVDNYNYVDCSYVKLLLEHGIIIWTIIIIGFSLVCITAINHNKKYMALALAFVAIYCVIEPRLIEIGFNPFILTLALLIDKNVVVKGKKKQKYYLSENDIDAREEII